MSLPVEAVKMSDSRWPDGGVPKIVNNGVSKIANTGVREITNTGFRKITYTDVSKIANTGFSNKIVDTGVREI